MGGEEWRGTEGTMWLWIALVPSVSLAVLESGEVLGSILALLEGNMASPLVSAHRISAEAFSAWHRHLLVVSAALELRDCSQRRGKGLLKPCSTSVTKVARGRSRADTLPQNLTMFSNSCEKSI